MLNIGGMNFDAEAELEIAEPTIKSIETQIIAMFKTLPKDRQKAILTELWSEVKPVRTYKSDMFKNLPF